MLLLCAFLSGCSHLTSEIGPPLPATPEITVGRSTSEDVLEKTGVPSQVSATPAGFVFLYEHNDVTENQLGFTLNRSIVKWFKFVYARSRLEHTAWVLCFDTNQVLQAWGKENWKEPLGQGMAAQFLVTAQTLVDSSPVRQPATQHEWGEMWLTPLPQALNVAQSLQDGRFGLEQTLAPTAVGQHTLEMVQPLPPRQQALQSKQ
jgi:hypothetical protein